MSGLFCEIILKECASEVTLIVIDEHFDEFADLIERTRKGRVWEILFQDRWIRVAVSKSEPAIELTSPFHDSPDFTILQQLSRSLALRLDGIASEPER